MRLRVGIMLDREVSMPINHQHLLQGVVYRFLERADSGYAQFLHSEGYAASLDDHEHRRFKLFVFSPLRARRRRADGILLRMGPGPVEWLISSPIDKFLTEFATGLLSEGFLAAGRLELPITQVETLPAPDLEKTDRFTCLSPIVASVSGESPPMRAGGMPTPEYLRPDDPRLSERVRCNLIAKHLAIYGKTPFDDRLILEFDAEYLARCKGTRLIDFKGIRIAGAFAPFRMSGSPELMRVGYECGLGEKNSGGFGMVEVRDG